MFDVKIINFVCKLFIWYFNDMQVTYVRYVFLRYIIKYTQLKM